MILQSQYWYDVVPRSGDTMSPIAGKWLYIDETEKLHALLAALDTLVEAEEIPSAKRARKLPGVDPFPEKQCVLCVFTSGYKVGKRTNQRFA
jgi:hypothetical protein